MGQTIEQYAAKMREDEKGRLTIRNYTDDVNFFASWYQDQGRGPLDLARLTKRDLLDWKQELSGARKMAASTVNRKLSAIASFLKWAQDAGLARSVGVPKKQPIQKQPPKWLTRNEKNALLRAVEDSENQLHLNIVTILLNTGLRVSELAALKWSQIKQSDARAS